MQTWVPSSGFKSKYKNTRPADLIEHILLEKE